MDILRKRKKIGARLSLASQKGGNASSYVSYQKTPTPAPVQKTPSKSYRYDDWSQKKLEKELRRVEQEQEKLSEERKFVYAKKLECERLAEENKLVLMDLFESKTKLRASYVDLLSHVYREAHKAKREQVVVVKELQEKREKERTLEELLIGLQARFVRNKKYLWEMQKSALRLKLQTKLHMQDALSREIQLLRAHKEKILLSLQTAERNEELASIKTRRRGRVISGLDLHVLSQKLETYGKKKDLETDLVKIQTRRAEYQKVRDALVQGIHELRKRENKLLFDKAELQSALAKIQEEKRTTQKPQRQKFSWKTFHFKSIRLKLQPSFVVFAIIALLLPSIPGAFAYVNRGISAKGFVLGAATNGMEAAKIAGTDAASSNLGNAASNLNNATNQFARARAALESLGPVVTLAKGIPVLSQVSAAHSLVDAAENISLASARLTEAASVFNSVGEILPKDITGSDAKVLSQTSSISKTSFADALTNTQNKIAEADAALMKANKDLEGVSLNDIPKEYQDKVAPLFDLLPNVSTTFHTFAGFYSELPTLFGVDEPRKYMLLFLNNNELRGPGGFLGSFGLMDVDQGKINNIKVFGVYDPDGQFQQRLYPPAPLRIINPRWFMRDVWYPDFPTTAQKVMDFYEKSDGPSVDGAISFTPTIFENLLKITGPVNVPEHNATVTADNFLEVTQYKVEIDYDKELNQPKKFLSDLMPHLVLKLTTLPQEKWIDVASVFANAMSEKQLQAYFRKPDLEQKAKEAGIAGEIKDAPKDYLNIVNNNVLGNKTDLLITQNVQHSVEISSDGTVIDELTVTRNHTGTNAWPSGRNREFISVFVPKDSKLLSYSGFDTLESKDVTLNCDSCTEDPLVQSMEAGKPYPNSGVTTYEEFGKTVFAGWQYLDPGATKTYTLKYQLPFKVSVNFFTLASTYSLLLQKQAGSVDSKYRLQITVPKKMSFAAVVPRGLTDVGVVRSGSLTTFETQITNDRFFGAVVTK